MMKTRNTITRSQRIEASQSLSQKLTQSQSLSSSLSNSQCSTLNDSQVLPSCSIQSNSNSDLASSDLKTMIENCVQFLIIADQKKIPIKKSEILKNSCPNNKKLFNSVIQGATEALNKIFGIKLIEMPDKAEYILVNAIPIDNPSIFETDPSTNYVYGVLLPILALIFMKGEETKQEYIWKFLEKLGLTPESRVPYHNSRITMKELVNLWLRQRYLKQIKKDTTEGSELYFDWGFRAHTEVDKMELLEWVCEVHGDGVEPSAWRSQYMKALKRSE